MSLSPVSQADFAQKLHDNKRLVLKFTAAWCAPCRAFTPTVEAAAKNHPDVAFLEVDIDKDPGLAAQWRVRSVPTTIGFKEGNVAFQFQGAVPPSVLEGHLKSL